MNDVSYLQEQRMTAEERQAFRDKYDLDSLNLDTVAFDPVERFAAVCGHAEYESSMH